MDFRRHKNVKLKGLYGQRRRWSRLSQGGDKNPGLKIDKFLADDPKLSHS